MPRKEFESFTRLDASDVNTFLMDQSVMTFGGTAARGSAITEPVEGMVSYLEDSNTIEAYNSSAWVTVANAGTASFNLVQTLYFTSSGTFTKATYPWLRAIKVKVQGGGGGASGAVATGAGQVSGGGGGGGGGYAEKFITDIAGLSSSVTVTVGAGGPGGVAANGTTGANSVFGSVTGNGGGGGNANSAQGPLDTFGDGGSGGSGSGGDLNISGSGGGYFFAPSVSRMYRGGGGNSQLGGATVMGVTGAAAAGFTGQLYGGGGVSAANSPSQSARNGGAGAQGIVIVELYA
jgi:hypothetical protein